MSEESYSLHTTFYLRNYALNQIIIKCPHFFTVIYEVLHNYLYNKTIFFINHTVIS